MKDPLAQLRSLMVGKKVMVVDPPGAGEAICKFVLDDGKAFRLHATELGFWIEETAGVNGYGSLNALITDYGHHMYNLLPQYDFDPPSATITVEAGLVEVKAPDGKSFIGDCVKFSDYEQLILGSPKGREILAKHMALGDYWMSAFRSTDNPDCPPELHWKNE